MEGFWLIRTPEAALEMAGGRKTSDFMFTAVDMKTERMYTIGIGRFHPAAAVLRLPCGPQKQPMD
jgi:hypothetical protein